MISDHPTTRDTLERTADEQRMIAHRLHVKMALLLRKGRYSVGDIAEACRVASHTASENPRLMERSGMLHREREGRRTFYHVADSCLSGILGTDGPCLGER